MIDMLHKISENTVKINTNQIVYIISPQQMLYNIDQLENPTNIYPEKKIDIDLLQCALFSKNGIFNAKYTEMLNTKWEEYLIDNTYESLETIFDNDKSDKSDKSDKIIVIRAIKYKFEIINKQHIINSTLDHLGIPLLEQW
jgi:hypothetical protein